MSMLSSQCDTLRVAADALEDDGVMPHCAKLMRDAADTIWQLRGERDRLKDENAKLSDLAFDMYYDLCESAPCIYSKYGERMCDAGIEVTE